MEELPSVLVTLEIRPPRTAGVGTADRRRLSSSLTKSRLLLDRENGLRLLDENVVPAGTPCRGWPSTAKGGPRGFVSWTSLLVHTNKNPPGRQRSIAPLSIAAYWFAESPIRPIRVFLVVRFERYCLPGPIVCGYCGQLLRIVGGDAEDDWRRTRLVRTTSIIEERFGGRLVHAAACATRNHGPGVDDGRELPFHSTHGGRQYTIGRRKSTAGVFRPNIINDVCLKPLKCGSGRACSGPCHPVEIHQAQQSITQCPQCPRRVARAKQQAKTDSDEGWAGWRAAHHRSGRQILPELRPDNPALAVWPRDLAPDGAEVGALLLRLRLVDVAQLLPLQQTAGAARQKALKQKDRRRKNVS